MSWTQSTGSPVGVAAGTSLSLAATGAYILYRNWDSFTELIGQGHTLTEAEEKIVNLKDVNGMRALETVYDTITNKFVYHLQVDGASLQKPKHEESRKWKSVRLWKVFVGRRERSRPCLLAR